MPDNTHSHVLDHSYSLIDSCLNIHVLNVCGLKSKLLCPDFLNLISQHDILVFTETKLDDVDIKNVRSEFAEDTENTSVGDLVEKLDDFIFFSLKYVNLC